jgi:hypothetical protein
MSNDLNSILARHNLKGINVANFSPSASSQRPTPPQQPYQYPVPVSQPRTPYTWAPPTAQGGSAAVRPSFAWPAPPQPRYTIDPRHYSYDIWGKAPVFSMTGEDEDEEESASEAEGYDDAQGVEEGVENDKAAEEAVAEEIAEESSEKDGVPPGAPVLNAVTSEESGPELSAVEPSAEHTQEEECFPPAVPTTAGSSAGEERVDVPMTTASDEAEPETSPAPVDPGNAEAEVQDSESVPDAVQSVEPDNQTSEEGIETADALAEQVATPVASVADEPVEAMTPESKDPGTAPGIQEEPVDSPQLPEQNAEDIASDDSEVAKTPEQPSSDPSSTELAGEDISQEDQPSQYIPEEPKSAESTAPTLRDSGSSVPTVPTEHAQVEIVKEFTESENTPDAPPVEPIEDPDEIVQIINVNGDGSTDDTAAIVVVPTPPPPPPTGLHVTIAEPTKPPKSSRKKSSSSKYSKSRSVEKPKEKPVEIIQLKEARIKTVGKGKGKKKSKSSSGKGGEDLVPPPPPPMMIVDVPPRAPSPPPSGLVIEVVGDQAVQVVDSSVEKKEDFVDGVHVATAPEVRSELVEVLETEEDSILAMDDQEKDNVETKAQEEDVASVHMPPPPLESDVPASSLEDSGSDADGNKPQLTHEESASQPEIIAASAEDTPVDSLPDSSLPEDTPIEESGLMQAGTTDVESHEQIASEDGVVAAEDMGDGENGSLSPDSSIEQEDSEKRTAEGALREGLVSAPVESDPMDIPNNDAASSTVVEGTSAPIEESKIAGAEVVTESASTSMELVALILSSDSAPDCTEDASTKEADTPGGTSNTIPEVGVGEDNEISGEATVIVLPDEEDAVDDPPEALKPPEADVPDTKLEPDEKVENSKHQTSVEVAEEVMAEDKEPQDLLKVVERAPAEENSGSMPEDQSGDIAPAHSEEVETSDEAVVDKPENNLESNAALMESEKTPEADVSLPSDDTEIHKEEDEHGENPVEAAATELAETVPATSDEQVSETNAPNMDSPEILEDQAMDAPSPAAGEPDIVEEGEAQQVSSDQELRDTSIYQTEETNAATSEEEEEARVNPADDTGAQGLVLPAMEEVGEELAGMTPERAVSEEVASQHVDGEVEELTADQVGSVVVPSSVAKQASKPFVVESTDTEQLEDATTDSISIINDATTSTTEDGAQTEVKDSPDLSMPLLAKEAQIIQVTEAPEETGEDLSKAEEDEIKKAEESVHTAPSLGQKLESNETSSPEQQPRSCIDEQPTPSAEECATELRQPEEAAGSEGSAAPAEQVEPDTEAQSDPHEQEPIAEAEVLPEDSISQQQSRCETIPDSEPGQRATPNEEPTIDQPAPVETAEPPPSKHSSKVSSGEPPVPYKENEPASPPKERRKSPKSSSHRHSSSHHKVKDVSHPPSEPQPSTSPNQSRRRSSTVQAPPLGLFRKPSSAKPRSSRAEAAEQAELSRRAAELAAREEDVQRQLRRARRLAALEEQERQLREKEEELARLEAVEREKKRARHEERRRREQEALEQERERAEEAARRKELERAERRRKRKEAESLEGRRHRDDRPRAHKHKTDDTGGDRQRSRDEYYIREVPSSSKDGDQRRHRRSSRREYDEKPKKGFWKSLLGKV